jgi:hypothetical protein
MLENELAVAAARHQPKSDGEFLHHEEDRHEDELHDQQPIAPLGAALSGGDDAAGIGIRQHDDEAGADGGEKGKSAQSRGEGDRVCQGSPPNCE